MQGIKNDSGKRQWRYIDSFWEDLGEVVDVLTYGDTKYPAPDGANWKRLPDADARFKDALFRHLVAYRLGEKTDAETGKSHLAHLITNALILMYFDRQTEVKLDANTLDIVYDLVQQTKDNIGAGYDSMQWRSAYDQVAPYLEGIMSEIEDMKKN